MTGYPAFNYPAFFEAACHLRAAGHIIVSPAEQDPPDELAHILKAIRGSHDEFIQGRKYSDFLAHDVKIVSDEVEGIVFMPFWHKSSGARLEAFVGLMCKKKHFGFYCGANAPYEPVDAELIRDELRRNMP